MIERQHGVGFATAEVGLQLHYGIAALAGEAQHGIGEHLPQAFGEVGAPEKLGGVAVFVGAFAQVHLPEISGKFGLLVATAGDVAMGADDFAPGFEAAGDRAFDGGAGAATFFAAHLLVEAHTQQFHLHLFEFAALGRGDGCEQTRR